MKRKIRRTALFAAALCAVAACAGIFGACGDESKIELYSTYTYSDWEKISYSEWNSRKISYQFTTPTQADERIDGAVREVKTEILINLYSDGSMAIFQAGLYETEESMPDAVWYDRGNHISWAQFGVWVKEESCLKLYFICLKSGDGVTAQADDDWAKSDYCYLVTMNQTPSGSYSYAYSYGNGNDNYIQMFGTKSVDKDDENGHIKTGLSDSKSGGDIEFTAIEDWIATYNDETFNIA